MKAKFTTSMFIMAIIFGLVAVSPFIASADQGGRSKKRFPKVENIGKWFGSHFRWSGDNESESDDGEGTIIECEKFINRGIMKRLKNEKDLPPGWAKKCGQVSTTTPPVATSTLPMIINVSVNNIGTSTVTINWRTTEDTKGIVFYATGTPVASTSANASETATSTNHSLKLEGLVANTVYFYKIRVMDSDGNVKTSQTFHFRTKAASSEPVVDTTSPNIIFATTLSLYSTSTRVIWVTNEASDSKVWFGTTAPVNTTSGALVSATSLSYYHDLSLPTLATSTVYYYVVASADASGNVGTSTGSFTTLAN